MEISIETAELRVSQSAQGPVVTDLATGERVKRVTLLKIGTHGRGNAYLSIEGPEFGCRVVSVINADVTLGVHRIQVVDGRWKRVRTDAGDLYNIGQCTLTVEAKYAWISFESINQSPLPAGSLVEA